MGGIIIGTHHVGGLVGDNYESIINKCYSSNNIEGNSSIGGLAGWNGGQYSAISYSYSIGCVTGGWDLGGLIGGGDSDVNYCFWDTQTSGQTTSAGGTGKTTIEMKKQNIFTDAGWDFIDTWMINGQYNNGYPILRWQIFGVGIKEIIIPQTSSLGQNYPNPFNPTTTLQYGLPEQSDITLNIFDISGRKIKQWNISSQQPGWHEVIWDGTDMYGSTVSTGVYIYSLQAGDFVDTKKMVFMK
jgi:hypothetical protein